MSILLNLKKMLIKCLMCRHLLERNNPFFSMVFAILIILLNTFAVSAGSAKLSWDAPSTNEDGTPLTDLAGFKIYYGTSSGNYTQNIDVGNVTTYTVASLTDGLAYYFVVTAYNTLKNESRYSVEICNQNNFKRRPNSRERL